MTGPSGEVRAARFTPDGGDRFVGLWLGLVVAGRNSSSGGALRSARRDAERVLADADAVARGPAAMQDELRDAAAAYVRSCLDNPGYTSALWGMNRLEEPQIRGKVARDVTGALDVVVTSGLVRERPWLPTVLVGGVADVMGPLGVASVAAEARRRRSLAALADDWFETGHTT